MKKLGLLLVLVALLITTGYSGPVYAAGATLSLSPASGTYNKGCAFSMEIKLDTGGARTDGTDAILFYDPTRLSAAIRSGTIYSDYPGNNVDAQTGKITVSGLASVSSPFTGSGTLATVDFTVLGNAPAGVTQVKFDFDPNDKGKTTDSNVVERDTVSDVLDQVANASFNIGTGSCNSTVPRGGSESAIIVVQDPGDTTTVETKTPPELPVSADFKTTLIMGAVAGFFVIAGIIGLTIL